MKNKGENLWGQVARLRERIMKPLQATFYITGIVFFALAIGILLQFIL